MNARLPQFSLGQTVTVVDDQLGIDTAPVLPPASPFLCDVLHRQIQQLEQAVIGREDRSSLGHLPKLPVKSLDRIGGIDQLSQFLRKFEISAKSRPISYQDFAIFGYLLSQMAANSSRACSAAGSSTAV